MKKITVLKGDGIGPEVIDQAIKVLKAIEEKYSHEFKLDQQLIGAHAIFETGSPLPKETIESCIESDAVLLGAVGHPDFDNNPSAKVRPEVGLLELRKTLGLYCNIRPLKIFDGLQALSPLKNDRLENVDFIVYRELTGGIYFGEKGYKDENNAYDICSYSTDEIKRIARKAFDSAMSRNKKLCLVDKANVLETSRLWRKVTDEIANEYPEIEYSKMFVDNAAMQLIVNPAQFDVILTENMFGDILTDEASVISGSLGLLASASTGDSHALFEPIHGSYPQAAGKDEANPIATILSVAMMLDHFDMTKEAEDIRNAVNKCISQGVLTKDIEPTDYFNTSTVGDIISESILEEDLTINPKQLLNNMGTLI